MSGCHLFDGTLVDVDSCFHLFVSWLQYKVDPSEFGLSAAAPAGTPTTASFGQPSAMGGGPSPFGQPSTMGGGPNPSPFGQGGGGFGQPSTLGTGSTFAGSPVAGHTFGAAAGATSGASFGALAHSAPSPGGFGMPSPGGFGGSGGFGGPSTPFGAARK